MNVTVDLMNASSESKLPSQQDFQAWSQAVLDELGKNPDSTGEFFELSIRVVEEDESAELNQQYRHKNGSTNILSFPFRNVEVNNVNFLGDLAICAAVVIREAEEQNKPQQAHWAHMTVHGVLHLKDYDHEQQGDAELMEALEIRILNTLGYNNPYLQTGSL